MKRWIILILVLLLPAWAWAGFNVTTLSDFQKDVRHLLATDADPYHPDDTLTYFINIACREVASYGTIIKAESVIVTQGQQRYDLASDVIEVFAVFPCTTMGSKGLERIAFKDWGKISASTQLTQTRYYAVQPAYLPDTIHAKLWLYPAHSGADDTLIVLYYAEANELSSSTDTTNIPYQYTPLVVYYATALAFARVGMFNESAWWFALFDQTREKKGLLKQLDYIVKSKVIEKR